MRGNDIEGVLYLDESTPPKIIVPEGASTTGKLSAETRTIRAIEG